MRTIEAIMQRIMQGMAKESALKKLHKGLSVAHRYHRVGPRQCRRSSALRGHPRRHRTRSGNGRTVRGDGSVGRGSSGGGRRVEHGGINERLDQAASESHRHRAKPGADWRPQGCAHKRVRAVSEGRRLQYREPGVPRRAAPRLGRDGLGVRAELQGATIARAQPCSWFRSLAPDQCSATFWADKVNMWRSGSELNINDCEVMCGDEMS